MNPIKSNIKRPIFIKPIMDPFRKTEMDKIKLPGPVKNPIDKAQYKIFPNMKLFK